MRHGLESSKFDSHQPAFSTSVQNLLINSTLGVEFRLLLAIGQYAHVSREIRFGPRVSHMCLQQLCSIMPALLGPGDGGLAGNITLGLGGRASSPAPIGKWIGGSRVLGLFRFGIKRPPLLGPPGRPRSGNYGQFYFFDFHN